MRGRTGGGAPLCALVRLAGVPTVADATLRWSPARVVAPAEGPPVAAIADDGSALATWSHLPRPGPQGIDLERARVMVAAAPPGRGFAKPRALPERHAVDPHVAMNSQGDAAVIWRRRTAGCDLEPCSATVRIATRRAGGRFTPARTVGRAVRISHGPFAIVTPDRSVAVVWREDDRSGGRIMVSYARRDGRFSRPRRLGQARQAPGPSTFAIADNGRGQAAVGWWVGGRTCVRVAVLRADGRFAGPVAVRSPDRCFTAPRLAVGPRGHVAVTWAGSITFNSSRHHVAIARPGRRSFAYAGAIDGGGTPDVSIAADGSVRLFRAVVDDEGMPPFVLPTYRLEMMLRRPGGRFGRPQALATGTHAPGFPLAVDGRGRAVATWLMAGDRRIAAAVAGRGRAFGRARRIGPADGPLSARITLAVAGGGQAVALWHSGGRLRAARAVPR